MSGLPWTLVIINVNKSLLSPKFENFVYGIAKNVKNMLAGLTVSLKKKAKSVHAVLNEKGLGLVPTTVILVKGVILTY